MVSPTAQPFLLGGEMVIFKNTNWRSATRMPN
jgi:hypothetical protein